MPERIDGGRALAAIGGVVVIVSLFMDWFEGDRGGALSGWATFEIADLLLAALALAAIAAPYLRRSERVPDATLAWVSAAALAIVVATLVDHPPAAAGRSLAAGAWVALAGAVTMALGALLTTTRVSLVITLRSRRDAGGPQGAEPRPIEGEEPEPEREGYVEDEVLFPEYEASDTGDEDTVTVPLPRRRRR